MGLGCLRPQEPFGGRRELALLLRWVLREAARLRTAGVAGSKNTHGANAADCSFLVALGVSRPGPMVALRDAQFKARSVR